MKARISHIKDTLIVELPKCNPKGHSGYILREKYPHFSEIENLGWIDSKQYGHEEMIRGNYGAFDQEIEPEYFIPLVRLSTLLNEPKPGRSFYGLIRFAEPATPSDYLKEREILESSAVETIYGNLMIVGEGKVRSMGYYHSFPVVKVEELNIYRELEKICKEFDIEPKNKFQTVLNLLTKKINT